MNQKEEATKANSEEFRKYSNYNSQRASLIFNFDLPQSVRTPAAELWGYKIMTEENDKKRRRQQSYKTTETFSEMAKMPPPEAAKVFSI